MARQPRFIEDDEPVVRRGSHESRAAAKDAEDVKPVRDDAEDVKAIEKALDDHEEDPKAKIRYEEARYVENDYEYDDDDNYGKRRNSGKRIALLIVALLLGFAIVGAGVYALIHFVIMPDKTDTADEVAATEEPTLPAEPTLAPVPTQPPTQAPTEPPAPNYLALADTYMADMSDYEKLCQLFIVTPEVLTAPMDNSGGGAVTVAGSMTEECLEDYPVGGIIYFADNLEDTEQVQEMIANSQDYASIPLFIAVDEEGGDVARVADKLHTKEFDPMFTYKDKGEEVAHDNAEIIGSNLSGLGFNMDNAPVADVLSNPDNTVIGERAYSDDFNEAAKLVPAAVRGFHDGGVITVLKHFPGHGSTDEDSHDGLAYVKSSLEDLKKNELLPFRAGMEAGADMVMVGHLVVEELDPDLPATLSSKVVPELLRKQLGYDGIAISDSMSMGAIDNYSYDEIVKGLFAADIDIILQPDDLDSYIEAIQDALDNGDITQEQIDKKVRKIIALKIKQGIIKAEDIQAEAETAAPIAPGTTDVPAPTDAPVTPAAPQQPAATAIPGARVSQPSVAA